MLAVHNIKVLYNKKEKILDEKSDLFSIPKLWVAKQLIVPF